MAYPWVWGGLRHYNGYRTAPAEVARERAHVARAEGAPFPSPRIEVGGAAP